MHQTTVRFSADLWSDLEREARRNGVSAAQYIREATLARIAYGAGARGEAGPGATRLKAVAEARERVSDSEAVWAQARLARERSRAIRDSSRAVQELGADRRAG